MQTIKQLIQKFHQTSTSAGEYDNVELTKDEIDEALKNAKAEKYWKLEEQRRAQEKKDAFHNLTRLWTYEEMKAKALARATELVRQKGHRSYVIDESNQEVFDLLTLYFTNDKRFEERGYSLRKGIMLMGNVGTGKTELLKAFQFNRRKCFEIITAINITAKIKHEEDQTFWKYYTHHVPNAGGQEKYFLQNQIGWMIDDFGTEEPVNVFGNKVDPILSIILNRYENPELYQALHVTTNLNGDMIEKRYDFRFRDRLREMFNVIELKGQSRRV